MMFGSEHRGKIACEQRRRYFAHSLPTGPSKAEMREALAEAARNTANLTTKNPTKEQRKCD